MRPLLGDRHAPVFGALSPEQTHLVYGRLMAARALSPALLRDVPEPHTGEELLSLCQQARLDHAGVVLTLCRETSQLGVSAIETLVGRPIRPWRETAQAQQAAQPRQVARGAAAPRPRDTDSMVVVSHVPNPKRPGTAGHARYLWRVGALVSELLAEGMWSADVKWDLDRGFVVLASQSSPEGQAARASLQQTVPA